LDVAKLLWLTQHEIASELFRSGELRDASDKAALQPFIKHFMDSQEKVKVARRQEAVLDPVTMDQLITAYCEAAREIYDALKALDRNVLVDLETRRHRRSNILRVSAAIATGLGGFVLGSLFTSNNLVIAAIVALSSLFGYYSAGANSWKK